MARRGGRLRVVAGEAGGRLLDGPDGDGTRPTSDRVRQAMFNALESLDVVEGARVVDAYAGTGALGIEALSRGAARATFADTDRAARAVVEANLRTTGLDDRAVVLGADGVRAISDGGPWDLVLLDPPYAFARWDELLTAAAARLAEGGVIVIESDREVALPASLGFVRSKRYGSTVVAFASASGASP